MNINSLLLDSNVNNYTKILIILSQLEYRKDFYIPNKKLLNICKKKNINISERNIQKTLLKLKENKKINLFYKNNKRYFNLVFYINQGCRKSTPLETDFEYNWLDESL